ncbi:hypothetical protein [Streptomyces sp. PCS3-D2]|nr:hypothetical protein [Streptomyces sp. PCS3-D2]
MTNNWTYRASNSGTASATILAGEGELSWPASSVAHLTLIAPF